LIRNFYTLTKRPEETNNWVTWITMTRPPSHIYNEIAQSLAIDKLSLDSQLLKRSKAVISMEELLQKELLPKGCSIKIPTRQYPKSTPTVDQEEQTRAEEVLITTFTKQITELRLSYLRKEQMTTKQAIDDRTDDFLVAAIKSKVPFFDTNSQHHNIIVRNIIEDVKVRYSTETAKRSLAQLQPLPMNVDNDPQPLSTELLKQISDKHQSQLDIITKQLSAINIHLANASTSKNDHQDRRQPRRSANGREATKQIQRGRSKSPSSHSASNRQQPVVIGNDRENTRGKRRKQSNNNGTRK
jgi:hypothetical protein